MRDTITLPLASTAYVRERTYEDTIMDYNKMLVHLSMLMEWDPDAIVDALDITTEELLDIPEFQARAMQWIEENNE